VAAILDFAAMLRPALATAALISSVACTASTHRPAGCYATPEDEAVWATAVPSAAGFRGQGAFVEGTTATTELGAGFGEQLRADLSFIRNSFPELSEQTLASFGTNSTSACSFQSAGPALRVVPSDRLRRHFSRAGVRGNRGWATFEREFPGHTAFATVSRPGFNVPQDEALVYVGIHCGLLCGWGNYVHLRKTSRGTWTVVRIVPTWES